MGVISLPARRTASRQSKKIRLNLGPRLYGICRHVKKAIASPRVCLGVFFFCDAVCGFVVMLLLVLCKQAHGLARVDRYLEALLA